MNVLFIGDIVGDNAVRYLAHRLPQLRRANAVDLVIANAENSAPNGLGMLAALNETLFAAGVDVITGGNHSWDGHEVSTTLAHPRVLRPANMPEGVAGRGILTLDAAGVPITVINLIGQDAMGWQTKLPTPLPLYPAWLAAEKAGAVIVDLHSGDVNLKQAFGHAVDGQVAAVLGTHTHEPTLPLPILPGGTAFVAEVGMTGALGGVQGFATEPFVQRLYGTDEADFSSVALASGEMTLGAVLLTLDGERAAAITRVF